MDVVKDERSIDTHHMSYVSFCHRQCGGDSNHEDGGTILRHVPNAYGCCERM